MNCKELFNNKNLQKQITNNAGIYIFRNILNNKYYVGQAIRIRKRLISHIGNYNKARYDNPLYRAFSKYGLENFEYIILKELEGTDYKEIKKQLDILETDYIQQYNSYGNTGYNQTLGADGGVLGYKFTEEQKEKNRQGRLNYLATSGNNKIYCYNIKTKETTMAIAPYYLENIFNWKHGTVHSALQYKLLKNTYIVRHSEKEIEEVLKLLKNNNYNKGQFKIKIDKDFYIKFKTEHPNLSIIELANQLGVCKKTIYTYEASLGISHKKELLQFKVINISTKEINVFNVKDGAKYFNITEKSFRRMANDKSKSTELYRKLYKIEKLL